MPTIGQATNNNLLLEIRNPTDLDLAKEKKYYNGLGSELDMAWMRRVWTGAFGAGFKKQIREVYEVGRGLDHGTLMTLVKQDCCKIPEHPQSEIWLFGFSRGACELIYLWPLDAEEFPNSI